MVVPVFAYLAFGFLLACLIKLALGEFRPAAYALAFGATCWAEAHCRSILGDRP
jgi:hypothetical protein